MPLSDLHSARIELIIRDALRKHRHDHQCWCEHCDQPTETDEEFPPSSERVYDIDCFVVAKEIMIKLKKLEAELIPSP